MIVRKVGLLRFYFSEPDADRGVLSLLKPVYFVFLPSSVISFCIDLAASCNKNRMMLSLFVLKHL